MALSRDCDPVPNENSERNMNPVLADVLEAHGGIDRWHRYSRISATVVAGGALWAMKRIAMASTPHFATSDLHRQWTAIEPFDSADHRMVYVPDRVAIKTRGGVIIAERDDPRAAFDGHTLNTPWDPLHLGYFNGYAIWTCYVMPFLLAESGIEISEIDSITQDGRALRGLRARFPGRVATHCAEQRFYFGADGLLRRHDYEVDVLGGARGTHLLSDYVELRGMHLPSRHRVYMRDADGRPMDTVMVSLDISNYKLS